MFYDASRECWVGQLPRDEVGRRPKVSAPTEAEAHRKLYDLQRERDAGTLDSGRTTVGEYLKAWARDTLMLSDRAASTITKHEVAVRLHLVPSLSRIKLAKLAPMHVQRFVRDKLDAGTGRSTVQQSLTTLRQALKQAEIMCFAEGDRLYPMIVVTQATGLRQSEVLGLRWADLDLDEGWLHLRRQLGRDGVLRDLKTPAARRSLPLPRHVVDVLRPHREAQDGERAAIYWRTTTWCSRPTRAVREPAQRAPLVDADSPTGRCRAPGHGGPRHSVCALSDEFARPMESKQGRHRVMTDRSQCTTASEQGSSNSPMTSGDGGRHGTDRRY